MTDREIKIAFFGSSLVSAYRNGAATYYRGMLRELHACGYRITFYEPDAFERQQHRDIPDPEYARSVVYSATLDGVEESLADAEGADIIVKASGVGVFDEFLESAVLQFRGPDRQVIFWDVDVPATLDRVGKDPNDPFAFLIPEYDMVLTYGGGPPVVSGYESMGVQRCIPIHNGLDPTTHHPVEPDPRFEATLGFLGNRMPDREERVAEFFFGPAADMGDHRFLLGGNGWGEHVPELSNVNYLGHIHTRDHNAFNVTPRAVLNISRESMARYGFSPATRVFEAAGAGACLITDAREGIDRFLTPEKECLVARNGKEVVRHLRELTPERSRSIGRAALERMLKSHTYRHRAAELNGIFQAAFDPYFDREKVNS